MILTCPNCSMRYSASATAIGDEGRKVRCASCGHNWQVDASGKEKKDENLISATEAEIAAPVDKAETEQQPIEPATETRRDPKVAQAIRARREDERKQKQRIRSMAIWGGVALSVVLVFVASFMFKSNVVRIWPNTASFYSFFGVSVNFYGLEIQDITATRKMQGGSNILQIGGTIVNTSKRKQTVPLLFAEIIDENDQTVFSWLVEAEQAELEKGASLTFVTDVREPPVGALRVIVLFADKKKLETGSSNIGETATK